MVSLNMPDTWIIDSRRTLIVVDGMERDVYADSGCYMLVRQGLGPFRKIYVETERTGDAPLNIWLRTMLSHGDRCRIVASPYLQWPQPYAWTVIGGRMVIACRHWPVRFGIEMSRAFREADLPLEKLLDGQTPLWSSYGEGYGYWRGPNATVMWRSWLT